MVAEPTENHATEVNSLYSSLYGELRELAHRRLMRNEEITLLNTTALVHESYLKLLASGQVEMAGRAHFLGYAARVMRSVIVDCVRRRHAARRGGSDVMVPIYGPEGEPMQISSAHGGEEEIINIDQALEQLAKIDARLVRVVEMRYFAGLDNAEIASCLGITERTVRRDWEKARLLLSVALQ
jgi:RNA polymerase sigma factor (TIGR02999 family)